MPAIGDGAYLAPTGERPGLSLVFFMEASDPGMG